MPKSEKVFELLRLIEENDQLTQEDLGILLDVNPRSIYRYANTLINAGFPIYYSKRDEGYKILKDPANDFLIEELKVLKKSLDTYMPIASEKEFRVAKEIEKKIDRVLPKEKKAPIGEIDMTPTGITGHYGGTITIGHSSQPSIINPILTTSTLSANLLDLIFNRLVRYHSKEILVPELAERWDEDEDGRIWTFYLRDNVYFHDGRPLTAEDVVFTYRFILDPRNNSHYSNYYKQVYRFETEGDYIFKVILKEKDASFIAKMVRPIAPKHLLEDVDLHNTSFNEHPIGSGPFRFHNWTDDDTITLVANDKYFEMNRPFLDKLIFKKFHSQKLALEAVNKDEIDLAFALLSDISSLHPSFEIYPIPMPGYYGLFFNLKDPVLSDIKVRKALAYAIDNGAIIKDQLKGHSKVITGPFDVNSWAYNPKIRPNPYDPQEAVSLLKEAGFSVKDGRILNSDGEPLEIELFVEDNVTTVCKVAVAIKMHLTKIGIKVNIEYKTDDSSREEPFQTKLRIVNTAGDADNIYGLWHSSSSDNICSYQNSSVDDLLDRGRKATDFQNRKEIYHKIHELIAQDQPAVFIAEVDEFVCSNYRVKWIGNMLRIADIFATIKDWQIVEERLK